MPHSADDPTDAVERILSGGHDMETFACARLGLDCDFVASGETKEEVMQKAMEHGMTAHADLMAAMTPEQSAAFAARLQEAIQPE